jgi:predicted kinase
MAILTIMRGLPGSGKSTEAEKLAKEKQAFRLNSDLLRTMLHFEIFTGYREGVTQDMLFVLAKSLLAQGKNVIIDNTNLNPKVFEGWIDLGPRKLCLASHVEIVDIKTDVDECIRRDQLREKKVGKTVIIKMALQHQNYMAGEKVLLVDIDGTLANIEHRLKFASGETKNWETFFSLLPGDSPRLDVVSAITEEARRTCSKVILVSARPEKYRRETEEWLIKTGIQESLNPVVMLMRENNDKRDDVTVKTEMSRYLKNLLIEGVYDDRPRVLVNVWGKKLPKEKIHDVGDNKFFISEREDLNYWTV